MCGEETSLLASIEGRRGEPSQKPPFPFEKGLFESPTIINNVETLANVAPIIPVSYTHLDVYKRQTFESA